MLSVVPGRWGPGQVALAYQWYRSQVAIIGANGPSYIPGAADLWRSISVKVTGSKDGYASASRTSAGTTKVARGPA